MSSYDVRNAAQIAVDELLVKYKRRLRDLESTAERYREDEEVLKQLNLLAGDISVLKTTIDKVSKKGGLNGNKK
jgi:ribosomal protein RSM22 (predicted rRNA methylase)